MRTTLDALLAHHRILLTDGATGTNYFASGLASGEPPEFWNIERPEEVLGLHRKFIAAGADIILTNTFGCNRQRLKLHKAEERSYEIARLAATLARQAADEVARPVVVAGSVGPTGELFVPMGELTHELALASFTEQVRGLRDGGADVAWIETMSSAEEVNAAAEAAIQVGLPYVVTCSFDTAGRTMMGMLPGALAGHLTGLPVAPVAIGPNCGVGAADVLVSLLAMQGAPHTLVCKGNCGIPRFEGTACVYSGTPELMARYATLAVDAGARIVGGCCGTTPAHIAAMRAALDAHTGGERPDIDRIVQVIGPLTNPAPGTAGPRPARRSRR
jgi:5-methyltetrahydrofolate--homocysteine methyltransferase